MKVWTTAESKRRSALEVGHEGDPSPMNERPRRIAI